MGIVVHSPDSGREAWPVSLQCMDSQGGPYAIQGLAPCESPAMSCPAAVPMLIMRVNMLPFLVYCGIWGSGYFSVLQTSYGAFCDYLIWWRECELTLYIQSWEASSNRPSFPYLKIIMMIFVNHYSEDGCCSVAESCPVLCDPTDCSTPGSSILHHLPEFAQTHVYWGSDAM